MRGLRRHSLQRRFATGNTDDKNELSGFDTCRARSFLLIHAHIPTEHFSTSELQNVSIDKFTWFRNANQWIMRLQNCEIFGRVARNYMSTLKARAQGSEVLLNNLYIFQIFVIFDK